MKQELRSFGDVVRELSEKYKVPYEIVEQILIYWIRVIYESAGSFSSLT